MSYVICPGTILDRDGHPQPCGEICEVHRPAPVMYFQCPLDHDFSAEPSDVQFDGEEAA